MEGVCWKLIRWSNSEGMWLKRMGFSGVDGCLKSRFGEFCVYFLKWFIGEMENILDKACRRWFCF